MLNRLRVLLNFNLRRYTKGIFLALRAALPASAVPVSPAFWLTFLIEGAMPTANNMMLQVQMYGRGGTLLYCSPQPEPSSSLKSTKTTQRIPQKVRMLTRNVDKHQHRPLVQFQAQPEPFGTL